MLSTAATANHSFFFFTIFIETENIKFSGLYDAVALHNETANFLALIFIC